jgi:CHASE3 domain sensor protein
MTWLNERSRDYVEEVIAARNVRSAAVELRSALQSAASSQRGYMLTGNEIYLSPYGTAKTMAVRQLEALQRDGPSVALPHCSRWEKLRQPLLSARRAGAKTCQ